MCGIWIACDQEEEVTSNGWTCGTRSLADDWKRLREELKGLADALQHLTSSTHAIKKQRDLRVPASVLELIGSNPFQWRFPGVSYDEHQSWLVSQQVILCLSIILRSWGSVELEQSSGGAVLCYHRAIVTVTQNVTPSRVGWSVASRIVDLQEHFDRRF